jgi:hypothetical protein
MRKHTLIALSAFSALGASAITGAASSGTFNTTLNSTLTRFSAVRLSGDWSGRSSILSAANPILVNRVRRRHKVRFVVGDSRAAASLTTVFVHDSTRPMATVYFYVKPPKPRHKHVTHVSPPAPVVVPVPAAPAVAPAGGVWYALRMCESGGNYAENTGNGYYGAYQFSLQTWYGLGFSGLPSNASPATQDLAARELQAEAGWGQWPGCSAALGL